MRQIKASFTEGCKSQMVGVLRKTYEEIELAD